MAAPTFDTIPVIQNRNGMRFGAVSVSGVSTKHGQNDTDNGRLYGSIGSDSGGNLSIDLYSDYARQRLFLSGTGTVANQAIALSGTGGSAATGEVTIIGATVGETTEAILIVSLSVDSDSLADVERCQNMPGYDPDFGLAIFHSRATKQILLTELPAAIPYTFPAPKISAFVPLGPNVELPDLTQIESAESLRNASAMLALSMSADEAIYLEEFQRMGSALRARFAAIMGQIKAANAPAESVAAEVEKTTVQFGNWSRG